MVTGSIYLDVFVRNQESEKYLLAEKVEGWTHLVDVWDVVARQHPQTAYSVL